MIRPDALRSERPYGPWGCRGGDVWQVMVAAESGDVQALQGLLERDPNLYRAEYWYTQPLHFAVREGHLQAARVLLDAGADPGATRLGGDDLVTTARDRGHEEVARLLEDVRGRRQPADAAVTAAELPIHTAAAAGDVERVRALLDAEPELVHCGDRAGRLPLFLAVNAGAREVVELLLERGTDPNRPQGAEAPQGAALHAASGAGDRPLVELLLAHGADPNATIDSAGSATYAARTPELRQLLMSRGGTLDAYDLIWLDEDDEAVRRVKEDPAAAAAGCGGALAAACKLGKRDLVVQLLGAGARVAPVVTECRSYLWCDPDLLTLLLQSGMDPDLPDWLRATPLHDLCGRDGRGRPRPYREAIAKLLLDHGATIDARDEDYRSTPLAWAARNALPEMVELLLARGATVNNPGDEPWATPLAWATRRGHDRIAEILRRAEPTRAGRRR